MKLNYQGRNDVLKVLQGIVLVLCCSFAEVTMALTLSSDAFNYNQMLPAKYTCDGENVSPPLAWKDIPDNTQSFVLVMDDPDAPMGTWDHWILFNIPADARDLVENVNIENTGILPGMNSWKGTSYNGPCPPFGTHRYVFTLYALDGQLELPKGSTKKAIEDAMKGHILAQNEFITKYSRAK